MPDKYDEDIKGQDINVDDVVDFGHITPPGRYVARLTSVNPKTDRNNNPMIEARYDVLDGEHAGEEIVIWYSLSARRNSKGKIFAPGISSFRADLAAVNRPLPKDFRLSQDPNVARVVYAQQMHPKHVGSVVVLVYEEQYKDKTTGEQKTTTRKRIIERAEGGASTAKVASPEPPVDALAGLG